VELIKLAISSLDQVWKDKAENQAACDKHCKAAAEAGVDLIVFPEMTLTGFCMDAEELSESPDGSETVSFFKELAVRYRLTILFGFIAKSSGYSNRAIAVDPEGQVIASYDKIHPFVHAGEDKIFTGGQRLSIFRIKGAIIGLTICYDLRFPELYSALSKQCNLVVNIANWPASRHLHWDTLLRARAIENQFYMLGVNRSGTDGKGVEYCKSSICYHPSGVAEPSRPITDSLDYINLDIESLESFRQSFPTLSSRREKLYASF
jgi:predicted amidohydrolase